MTTTEIREVAHIAYELNRIRLKRHQMIEATMTMIEMIEEANV
jgi:hypothetical protein